jgi:hypothetical protein
LKDRIINIIIVLGVASTIYFRISIGYVPYVEPFIRCLWDTVHPSEDLYKPIILDTFQFTGSGFIKSYNWKPENFEQYEFGFLINQKSLPVDVLKHPIIPDYIGDRFAIEIYDKNKLILRTTGKEWHIKEADSENIYFVVMVFDVPYNKDLTMKVILAEDNTSQKAYRGPASLFVKVRPAFSPAIHE